MNDRAEKATKEFVRQRPSHCATSAANHVTGCKGVMLTSIAVENTSVIIKGLLRSMSPIGHRNSRPAAYPDCIKVATEEARSKLTSNVSAILFKTGWL